MMAPRRIKQPLGEADPTFSSRFAFCGWREERAHPDRDTRRDESSTLNARYDSYDRARVRVRGP